MHCPHCGSPNDAQAHACSVCGVGLTPTTAPSQTLPVGSTLAGHAFTIGKVLGQGGFGITYLGGDTRLRRPVAIKEFFPQGCVRQQMTVQPTGAWTPATYAEARQRFLEEGQRLARLEHPGIVKIYAALEANNTAYLVMEYIRGQTLAEVLTLRGGRLEEAEALGYLQRAGEALEAVHAAGLLHRDLKPDNLMLSAEGRVVLVDFGTAREFVAGQTQRHSVTLTPGYAPLEQYAQRAQRGPYTDVYALAATAYHLLSGEQPVAAPDRANGVELPPLRQVRPQVSAPVAEGVMAGLVMDARQRPASVRAWLELLRGGGRPPTPTPQPPVVRLAQPAPRLENSMGMSMVLIPAGEFRMGSTMYDDEKPPHTVRLSKAFYLGTTPVTQRQWQAVMGTNPSQFTGEDRPVEQVSWYDAVAFCIALSAREGLQPCYVMTDVQRGQDGIRAAAVRFVAAAGYRLPTEAEWEYSARAGSTAAYCYGDDEQALQHYAWYRANAGGTTHPVGKLRPNAWGLYDMHGNVWEWVQDWYATYASGTAVDPTGPATGAHRVDRGGSWYDGARLCRSANRRAGAPGIRFDNLGLRLLRLVP